MAQVVAVVRVNVCAAADGRCTKLYAGRHAVLLMPRRVLLAERRLRDLLTLRTGILSEQYWLDAMRSVPGRNVQPAVGGAFGRLMHSLWTGHLLE
jgi:hypothetical protein